jgi:hypothetical protein
MRENQVEMYKLRFEANPALFWSLGADLVDAGSPNLCGQSPAARKALGGHWQEAYNMWLADGEYSRGAQELYVGFILASEAIVNKRPSAKVPKLPKRVWTIAHYNAALRRCEDLAYRDLMIESLLDPGTTPWFKERMAIGALIKANQPEEAERLYREKQWDQNDMAEDFLALIHSCRGAESEYVNFRAMWHYYLEGDRPGGPVTFNKMKTLFLEGRLLGDCKVWRKGFKTWQPVTALKCFSPFVYAEELPPPVPE